MTEVTPENPNGKPEKKESDYKSKYETLLKKYNNLCEAIDEAGYNIMSIGKLNRIKNG